MNKKTKLQKGITLIALVITIVVLIILAATSVNIITNSGIVIKVEKASEEDSKQTASETMTLKITNYQMKSYSEEGKLPDLQYLADRLCEDNDIEYVNLEKQKTGAINDKISIGETTSIFTKLEQYPYEFEINSSLQLASVDGIKVAASNNNDNSNSKTQKTVLFSGKADTVNKEYELSDSIENYSFIMLYSSLADSDILANVNTLIIDTDEIDYENDHTQKYVIGAALNTNYTYAIRFKFSANNKLLIGGKQTSTGYTYNGIHYEIYKIVGIK